MKKIALQSLVAAGIVIFGGCAGNQINPLDYQSEIKEKVQIPEICMPMYKSAMPTVAVLDFTNNSTYGKAELSKSNSQTNSAAVVGVGVGAGGFVAAGASETKHKSNSEQRSVDAKLGESITPMIESLVFNSGGAKLMTRTDLDKVNAELKLQDSGLLDPASVVAFGKTSGVKFIVTGSIDNVEQTYRDNSGAADAVQRQTSQSDNNLVKIIGLIGKVAASVTDGMLIKSKVTVKIIDVETGKIMMSKPLEKEVNIGKIPEPTYDQVVGGIKKAVSESMPDLEAEFAQYFAVKGYISKLKTNGKDVIAQVSIGRNYKVEENTELMLYAFDENIDPMNGAKSCDAIVLPTKLRATNQLTDTTAWATVDGDAKSLKLNQLVQKSHTKGGLSVPSFLK